MADGKGCTCAAYYESECACDADWTPQELIDARAEIARLRLTDAEKDAIEAAANAYQRRFDDGVGLLNDGPSECGKIAATLRGLLERLGPKGSGERHE